MRVVPESSKITVFTRAEGLFSRVAHDLAVAATPSAGTATPTGDGLGEGATVELEFGPDALRVVGVMRNHKLDTAVLSASDRADIDHRMAADVLGGATLRATGTVRSGRVEIDLDLGRGEARAIATSVRVDPGAKRVRGETTISLKALGVKEIKGPLNAFRVADDVRVTFEIALE